MNYTERHTLPQWEKTDRIQMEDFNAAMAALDAAVPKIVTGTYTGNNAGSRTISLPFTPKAVLVADSMGRTCIASSGFFSYGGLAVTGGASNAVRITENGFTVHYSTSGSPRQITNYSEYSYFYLAIG